jgi:hypothetical protein
MQYNRLRGMHALVTEGLLTVHNIWFDHCLSDEVLALCVASVLGEGPAWLG